MSKHTPGPWIWDKADLSFRTENGEELITALGCKGIAEDVKNGLITWDAFAPSDADGRLMAAAPDLLEALEDCIEALRRAAADGELRVAYAAIAKARGEE